MKATLVLPGNDNRRSSAISQAGAEHLGLGSIAAYIRTLGHEATILNFQVEYYLSYWEGEETDPPSLDAAIAQVVASDPDVVGVSVTGITIADAVALSRAVKARRPGCHLCWGGHQAYQCAAAILEREDSVDTIVAGDGEIAFATLLDALRQGRDLAGIPGLWYRTEGGPRMDAFPLEPDLDRLPPPARDTLSEMQARGLRVTDARISTSRGCQFKCSFCVDPSLGYRKKWRARSADKVVDEIEDLVRRFDIDFLWFSEDNFIPPTPAGRARADRIASEILSRDLRIGYRALLRADAIDGQDALLAKLIASGLACVYVGIESGSPRRLAYLRKHETPELYRRVVFQLRKHRVGLQIGFIMFDPLTSWDDLEADARFLDEIGEMYLYSNFCQVLDVFPGAELTQVLIERGLLDPDFTYDSPADCYDYENSVIATMARTIQAAYKGELVEIDKFFQRLRVVDLPRLYRMDRQDPIAGLAAAEHLVESAVEELGRISLSTFLDCLDDCRAGRGQGLQRVLAEHMRTVSGVRRRVIEDARALPRTLISKLTALAPMI